MALRWISVFIFITLSMQGSWFPHSIIRQSYPSSWWSSIASTGRFVILMPNKQKKHIKDSHLFIRAQGRALFLNGMRLPVGNYIIMPESQVALIDGVSYAGPFSLYVGTKEVTLRAHTSSEKQTFVYEDNNQLVVEAEKKPSAYLVRVLLDEMDIHETQRSWKLACDYGFTLVDPMKQKRKKLTQEELVISHKRKQLAVNKTKYDRDLLFLVPRKGFASVDGVPYHGSFLVVKESNRLMLINSVELEEYVYCVLRTESWPGWPLEVNKVFAIASRSYVMAQMKMSRKKKLPYHVKNTNEHQTYQGMHNCLTRREAVDQTRGMFLAYNNQPVLAMFDSCCGGVVPAHIQDFDFGKADYLKRSYPCKHCKRCKLYSWTAEFEKERFHQEMERLLALNYIKEVKIAQKDKAGLVRKVQVKTAQEHGALTGQQFYKLFKEVKSFCFDMKKKSNKLIMNGRGFGHHLGLCQWGAREMVRDGWPYKRILQFYYPGTQFLTLPS